MKRSEKYKCFMILTALLATNLANANTVIVAGDEWLLSNQAFAQNPTNTREFANNVANSFGGTEYLIIEDANFTRPYGTDFQSVVLGLGRNLTVNPAEPFGPELLNQSHRFSNTMRLHEERE